MAGRRSGMALVAGMLVLLVLSGCSATSAPAVGPAKTATPSATSRGGTAPSCDEIAHAFATADVAVSTVVDKTAETVKAVSLGSVSYTVLRHCKITVPGRSSPSIVEIDGGAGVGMLAGLKSLGTDCTDLPVGEGYGDSAFVCPGPGSYYGLVGSEMVHVGPFFSVPDVEKVAQNIVKLLK